jgi:hypothetical protein
MYGLKGLLGWDRCAAPDIHKTEARELSALQQIGSELFWWRSRSACTYFNALCKCVLKDKTC